MPQARLAGTPRPCYDAYVGVRLLVFDGTPKAGEKALRSAWSVGADLYRSLGWVDESFGAKSWTEALAWLASVRGDVAIREVQFWGHGNWGTARIAEDVLSENSFSRGHAHREGLSRLAQRMAKATAPLLWFRTCETFGAQRGQRFAERCASELNARVAGHTFIIGALQSGLHGLAPGAKPSWSASEGLVAGDAERPLSAAWSSLKAPNTIHFMNHEVPERWFE